jgi:hypothetical protein
MKILKPFIWFWNLMDKEHNRLTFIVSFVALIASISVPTIFHCNEIKDSKAKDVLNYVFRCEGGWVYFRPANDAQRINRMVILLNSKMTSKTITPSLSEGSFSFGDIDSETTDLKTKNKCDAIEFPIIIKSKYYSNGKALEDQTEYVVKLKDTFYSSFLIEYVKHRSDRFDNNVTMNYLSKCQQ